ncbi:MAG: phage tail protein I [Gammaproteobacteria bacterium]|nr:phage tail protein I [Gammaproteobacteria bacterium]
MNKLTPPNATALENNVDETLSRIGNINLTNVGKLWNPDTCPEPLLPFLAWAESVPEWSSDWPIAVQRAAIKVRRKVRRTRGTKKAVVDSINAFGGAVVIAEWFEQSPPGDPRTFNVILAANDSYVDEGLQDAMKNTIDEVKPLSAHYVLGVGLSAVAAVGVTGGALAVNYARIELEG